MTESTFTTTLLATGGNNVGIDNLSINGFVTDAPPVPEPASIAVWSLLGLALAGFGCFRACRKK